MTEIDPDESPPLSARVELERIRLFFGQSAGNLFSVVIGGLLIGALLRSAGVADVVLATWFVSLLVAVVAVSGLEAWLLGRVPALVPQQLPLARRYLRWRIGLGACVAALYGLSVYLLPVGATHAEQAFLFMIVSTVVTLGTLGYAATPAYYLMLTLLAVMPLTVHAMSAYVVRGDSFDLLLAVMSAGWQVVVLLKARRLSATAIEAIDLSERLKDALQFQRETQERMGHMAMHDELTGLANRRYFEQVFVRTRSLAEREGSRFGVMSIDLNDFKPVNDRHGHAVGDAVLQSVANRLQKAIRASDFCARIGGDEFALIIDKVHTESDLDGMATKLRAVLGKPFLPKGIAVASGVSVGWALFPSDGQEMAPLLAVADRRMQSEKLAQRRAARARA